MPPEVLGFLVVGVAIGLFFGISLTWLAQEYLTGSKKDLKKAKRENKRLRAELDELRNSIKKGKKVIVEN